MCARQIVQDLFYFNEAAPKSHDGDESGFGLVPKEDYDVSELEAFTYEFTTFAITVAIAVAITVAIAATIKNASTACTCQGAVWPLSPP